MNEVLLFELVDGGAEEHGLVVGVGKDKQDVVLLFDDHSLLVDVDHD